MADKAFTPIRCLAVLLLCACAGNAQSVLPLSSIRSVLEQPAGTDVLYAAP